MENILARIITRKLCTTVNSFLICIAIKRVFVFTFVSHSPTILQLAKWLVISQQYKLGVGWRRQHKVQRVHARVHHEWLRGGKGWERGGNEMRGGRRKLSTLPECAKKRENGEISARWGKKRKNKTRIEQRSTKINECFNNQENYTPPLKKKESNLDTCPNTSKKGNEIKSEEEIRSRERRRNNDNQVEETNYNIGREKRKWKEEEIKKSSPESACIIEDKGRGVGARKTGVNSGRIKNCGGVDGVKGRGNRGREE